MEKVTVTLTKTLHSYGDVEITETMRFANMKSALLFSLDMLGKRTKGYSGTEYTITAVSF